MKFKALFAAAALLASTFSQAAYVTIQDMSGVYSTQASIANTPIEIRIGAVTTFVRPLLLDINTDAEINDIFSLHVGAQNVVNFYFVDTIEACGGINPNIIGCGETPGQDFVVESDWAANTTIPAGGNITFGMQLLAHELGHNLGLQHRSGNYLMNSSINGYGDLNAAEVLQILNSPLVQTDATNNHKFIQINPVLILAADNRVPEPSTLALAMLGLLGAGLRARKLQAGK